MLSQLFYFVPVYNSQYVSHAHNLVMSVIDLAVVIYYVLKHIMSITSKIAFHSC